MKENKSISVIFLVWLPFGFEHFEKFISSYRSYPAGMDHQLLILFNGVNDPEEAQPYHDHLIKNSISYTPLSLQKGLDIEAYFFAANHVFSDYLFFLNTYSILQ